MTRKIRLASVGLGHRGRDILLGVLRGFDCVHCVAVCDQKPDLFFKPAHFYYLGIL